MATAIATGHAYFHGVNNAGIMDIPLTRTKDGLDAQTATNSFGPFLPTNLTAGAHHRPGGVSDVPAARGGHLHIDDLNWDTHPHKPMDDYNDSKLQIVLFSDEPQRRLDVAGSAVRSVLVHCYDVAGCGGLACRRLMGAVVEQLMISSHAFRLAFA